MNRWWLVKLSFAFVSLASAQAPVPSPERGPAERPPLPGFRTEPAPRFELPPVPRPTQPRLSTPVRIFVSRFDVTGATAFTPKELEEILKPYTGRVIGNEELEEARLAITRRYVAAGYVNSGAVIPDQQVRDGVVEIRVIEGRLGTILVGGENGFRPGFIESRMRAGAGPPMDVNRLQEQMQLLLQNPQIERINAEIGPGTRPGDAVLRMDVTEAPRGTYGLAFANNRSPAIGSNRAEASVAYRNPLGLGDAIGARFGYGTGIKDWLASYAVPVSPEDALLSVRYERTETKVVEPPFDIIDIQNDAEYTELGLSRPFYRTPARRLDLGALLTRRTNASFLLGQPFSFTPGANNGQTVVSALRLIADWTDRAPDRVIAARFTLSEGIDAMGSTVLEGGAPDSRFTTRLAQVQLARRLRSLGDQVLLRLDWQRSNGALLASEKFALGGMQSVRGYRENAAVHDNGRVFSAEYRRPLVEGWEGALFTDYGEGGDDAGSSRLASLGAGLRWTPANGFLLQLYKGFPLFTPENRTMDPQDRGIHFSAALQKNF
jgi:hemolysin activation/secretion protein